MITRVRRSNMLLAILITSCKFSKCFYHPYANGSPSDVKTFIHCPPDIMLTNVTFVEIPCLLEQQVLVGTELFLLLDLAKVDAPQSHTVSSGSLTRYAYNKSGSTLWFHFVLVHIHRFFRHVSSPSSPWKQFEY